MRVDSLRRTADRRKIVLNVTIVLGDEFAERTVNEDELTVTVTVRVRQPSGPQDLGQYQGPTPRS